MVDLGGIPYRHWLSRSIRLALAQRFMQPAPQPIPAIAHRYKSRPVDGYKVCGRRVFFRRVPINHELDDFPFPHS